MTTSTAQSGKANQARMVTAMPGQNTYRRITRTKAWLVFFCVLVFAGASAAETAHYHLTSGRSERQCSICIAAHAVARPALTGSPVSLPTLCVGVLFFAVPDLPESESILALCIRPPPPQV